MTSPWRGSETPEPPASELIATEHVTVSRLNGRPRDPGSGRHRRVVAFVAPTVSRGELAGLLREAADALELSVREEVR